VTLRKLSNSSIVDRRFGGDIHVTGFYIAQGDSEATVETLSKALNSDKGKETAERIERMFPLQKREELVIETQGLLEA